MSDGTRARWRLRVGRRAPAALALLGLLGSACHFFLDPDDLVAGRAGADGGGTSASDVDAGISADALDGGDEPPPWKGQVPACAPEPPIGTQVLAVVGGPPGTVAAACPSGYEATGQIGFGGIIDTGSVCLAGSCTCGALNTTQAKFECDNNTLTYFTDPGCTVRAPNQDKNQGFGGQCLNVDKANAGTYGLVNGSLQNRGGGGFPGGGGETCPSSGEAGVVTQTPRFGLEVHVCRAAPKPSATCRSGEVAATPTPDAVACYQAAGSPCANGYTASWPFAADQNQKMTDTRGCQCRCNPDPDAGCAGGMVNTFAQTDCRAGNATIAATCRPIADYGTSVELQRSVSPDLNQVRCALNLQKTGNVSPIASMTLCCMTRCDACHYAATSPGAVCASVADACNSDARCATLRDCIRASCSGSECGQCTAPITPDGGVPDPTVLAKYRTIGTCQANACPAPDCP